jgi:hypothetical protein
MAFSWADWTDDVAAGRDVAFLPWANNMVVLDCDVKEYAGGLVVDKDNPRRASFGPTVVKRGIDDLERLVQEHGHTMAELETYTVRTKSGGLHLYFDLGPLGLAKKAHHREDWRIDVITNPHNWVAAPPTPGYTVVNDAPVIPLPVWLHEILTNINTLKRPLGGVRRVQADDRAERAKHAYKTWLEPGEDILAAYRHSLYALIEFADSHGYWNLTIWQVTLDLLELGYSLPDVEKAVVHYAKPWDSHQENNVRRTVASAFRTFQDRSAS